MMARSRKPFVVVMSGAFGSACARRRPCWGEARTVEFRRLRGGDDHLARRAAAVASGVNPPEQRPSASAATADRRSAPPSSTAMMCGRAAPRVVVMSGAFQVRLGLPEGEPVAGPEAARDIALFARAMPAASSGASGPWVRRCDRRRADGQRDGDDTLFEITAFHAPRGRTPLEAMTLGAPPRPDG